MNVGVEEGDAVETYGREGGAEFFDEREEDRGGDVDHADVELFEVGEGDGEGWVDEGWGGDEGGWWDDWGRGCE